MLKFWRNAIEKSCGDFWSLPDPRRKISTGGFRRLFWGCRWELNFSLMQQALSRRPPENLLDRSDFGLNTSADRRDHAAIQWTHLMGPG